MVYLTMCCVITCTDGHHKLIRWRFVTHAGIDGYSRLIVFMHCSDNNRSTTVYTHFIKAIRLYGLPSRVRTDQGKESIKIAEHMLENRGVNRASIITGNSVHNQRIELVEGYVSVSYCYILPTILPHGAAGYTRSSK